MKKGCYYPIQPAGPTEAFRRQFIYEEFPPDQALSSVVYCYYRLAVKADWQGLASYHAVPDGCMDLVTHSREYRGGAIASTLKGSAMVTLFPGDELFSIRFLPGQINRLFQLPISSLVDTVSMTDGCFGGEIEELAARLFESIGISAKLACANQWLYRALSQRDRGIDQRLERAVNYVFTHASDSGIDSLCSASGLSARQLRRLFTDNLGVSPKHFSRMVRFQHSLKLLMVSPRSEWLHLIPESYYDQSHFYRDFKQLYGHSLSEFQP